jgi:hypothetical protein
MKQVKNPVIVEEYFKESWVKNFLFRLVKISRISPIKAQKATIFPFFLDLLQRLCIESF